MRKILAVLFLAGMYVGGGTALQSELTIGSCLYKYDTSASNGSRDYAKSSCEAWGGTLAIPDSRFIMEHISKLWTGTFYNQTAYIGGKRRDDGAFYWSTGIEVNTTYNGWNVNWKIRAGECFMGIRNQMEEPKIFWVTLNTTRNFVCQKPRVGANYCNGRAQYIKDANRCQEDCVCKEGYYGRNCEFQYPHVESCMMNSTSPITFPLNITCIITGHGINHLTTIQWKANGNILANNTDNNVFYQHVEMSTQGVATLILKRKICLGNMTIDVNVFHSFNGKTFISGNHSILLRSNYAALFGLEVEPQNCIGSTLKVRWNSTVPIHLRLFHIKTIPSVGPINTNSMEYELTGLSPNETYQLFIIVAPEVFCNDGNNVTLERNFTTEILENFNCNSTDLTTGVPTQPHVTGTEKTFNTTPQKPQTLNLIVIIVPAVCGVVVLLIIIIVCAIRRQNCAPIKEAPLAVQDINNQDSNQLESVDIIYVTDGGNTGQDDDDQSETTKTERVNELYGSTAFDGDELVAEATYAVVNKGAPKKNVIEQSEE